MALTPEEYLALSKAAYTDFTAQDKGKTIANLSLDDPSSPALAPLDSISGWVLFDYMETGSGFAGAAFKNTTGEIVFAIRGTEPNTLADLFNDAQIAFNSSFLGAPGQFGDAYAFVKNVVAAAKGIDPSEMTDTLLRSIIEGGDEDGDATNDITFTGHSLGGGVAQYLTYATGGNATTFNSVGVGQFIPGDPADYATKINDYVDQFDVIGTFGVQLGTTHFVQDKYLAQMVGSDLDVLRDIIATQVLAKFGLMSPSVAASHLNSLQQSLSSAGRDTYALLEHDIVRGYLLFGAHALEAMIQQNGSGDYKLTGSASGSAVQGIADILYRATLILGVVEDAGWTVSKAAVALWELGSDAVAAGGTIVINGYEWTADEIHDVGSGMWNLARSGFTSAVSGVHALLDLAMHTPRRTDPLVLDLDGDGLETTNVANSNAYFDLDSNGFAEKTAWVGSDDGLLVYDRNNDGVIDNGGELFGDHTVMADGTVADSGFTALSDFDSNGDGIIDNTDDQFADLQIWRDLDGDGETDAGELSGLADNNIASISLTSANAGSPDGNGNIVRRTGSYIDTSNTTHQIGEFLLSKDGSDSEETPPSSIPVDIAQLPFVSGSGNVASLYTAMIADSTGTLKGLVQDFVAAPTATERREILPEILFQWTGKASIDPASRGGLIDARALGVLEAFFGNPFVGMDGTSNPNPQSVVFLKQAYDQLVDQVYVQLITNSSAGSYLNDIPMVYDPVTMTYSPDMAELEAHLDSVYADDGSDAGQSALYDATKFLFTEGYMTATAPALADYRAHFAFSPHGLEVIDTAILGILSGTDASNYMVITSSTVATAAGFGGDDYLSGSDRYVTNDRLYGGAGNDSLVGNGGADLLDGGTGNDAMDGGTGNDTYLFGRGYGQDTIIDADATAGNVDAILFQDNISPEDVTVTRDGSALVISVNGTSDKLTLTKYFSTIASYYANTVYYTYDVGPMGNKIEQMKFKDGTVWTVSDIMNMASVRLQQGTAGNDSLQGYADLSNTLKGDAGDDSLSGNVLADTLDGGTGNDTLKGGLGNDIYVFGRGYGVDTITDLDETAGNVDTISFNADVNPSDVVASRNGYDLVLSIVGTADKLTVANYFSTTTSYWDMGLWHTRNVGEMGNKVEQIVFADGTVWSVADVKTRASYTYGTENADTISGFNDTDDIIHGLGGNDNINGNGGSDTLYGDDGDDTLYNYDGASNVSSLYGGAGNDTLTAGIGSDVLDGGAGADQLKGGLGNDIYVFGRGYGTDTITDLDETAGNIDKIQFNADVNPSDVAVSRNGYNLELSITGTTDKLIVANYFSTTTSYWDMGLMRTRSVGEMGNKVEQITFADGTVWDVAAVTALAGVINGTAGADTLSGFSTQDDIIHGLGGNDNINGNGGSDTLYGDDGDDTLYNNDAASETTSLYGGTGNDTLTSGSGTDLLDGGTGNDTLKGGTGNDTYIFNRGYGVDTVTDLDENIGNVDTVQFGADILPADIQVVHVGTDLELRIAGTTDKLVVANYFSTTTSYWDMGLWHSRSVGEMGNKVEQFAFSDGTIWNVENIKDMVNIGTDTAESITGYDSRNDTIRGLGGNDTLTGLSGDDSIYGGDGNDTLDGGLGNDLLDGGAGNDTLTAGAGNDQLDGGAGTDTLNGDVGNDTYIFGRGYGTDTITDSDATAGNTDTVQFAAGVVPADVLVRRNGIDLELTIAGTTDKLVVQRYFSSTNASGVNVGANGNKVEQFTFGDGTVWGISDIQSLAQNITGTTSSDTLTGFTDQVSTFYALDGDDTVTAGSLGDTIRGGNGNDTINGGVGNDTLYGDAGNDTIKSSSGNDFLDGGAGTDMLEGASGNDTYVFGLGYGVDTIYDTDATAGNVDTVNFLAGIAPADISVRRNNTDLELTIAGTSDKLIVEKYFTAINRLGTNVGANGNKVEQFVFADGTVWDIATVMDKARYIYGTSGADNVTGFDDQNDVLDGGAGNDTLTGLNGADTYVFGRGYGQDAVAASSVNNSDTVKFLAGVAPSDIIVSRGPASDSIAKNNLILTIAGTTDQLTVRSYFAGTGYQPAIVFNDGTTWGVTDVKALAHTVMGTTGADIVYGYDDQDNVVYGLDGDDGVYGSYTNSGSVVTNDTVYGGNGNDTLYGYYGNDTLDGGAGNDTLVGGAGNDTYVFGLGYGQDTILADSTNNQDVINFLSGVSPSSVTVSRGDNSSSTTRNDLILSINGTSDKLTVRSYFSGTGYQIPVHFADGTVWGATEIKAAAHTINGTSAVDNISGYDDQNNIIYGLDGNDTLNGSLTNSSSVVTNDQLYGGNGNDVLYGNYGDDMLDGGAGNDTLDGGVGNDTYVFGLGYGQDTIIANSVNSSDTVSILSGVNPSDIVLSRGGAAGSSTQYDLVLSIAGTSDKLTIRSYLASAGYAPTIRFSDGTAWDTTYVKNVVRTLNGTTAAETITGYDDQNNIIYGLDGNDTINGNYTPTSTYATNDQLYGGNGNDTLYGNYGNDTLDGGAGNDVLNGGNGNDTYVFGLGYGQDTVSSSSINNADTVTILSGVNPADITLSRGGVAGSGTQYDLVLSINGTSDKLTIQTYLAAAGYAPLIQFSDGTTWDTTYVKNVVRTLTGTAASETITGYDDQNNIIYGLDGNDIINSNYTATSAFATNDQLYGGNGNDTLYGNYGDDMLDGGAGNDTLNGGNGNDTYIFGLGYGQDVVASSSINNTDTVSILSGVNPADVTLSRGGAAGSGTQYDLVLSINGTSDKLTIQTYLAAAGYAPTIRFSDGTTWDTTYVKNVVRTLTGTAAGETITGYDDQNNIIYGLDGNDTINSNYTPTSAYATNDQLYGGNGNDTLYGNYGNDTLNGGTGNDTLSGGNGNDTYVFNAGDGNDTVTDGDGTSGSDKIVFANANPLDIIFAPVSSNLSITTYGTTDSVTVTSWTASSYKVETIQAANGSTISSTQLDQLIQAMATYSANNGGMSWSAAIANNPTDVQAILSQYWVTPA